MLMTLNGRKVILAITSAKVLTSTGNPIRGYKRQEDGTFSTKDLGKIFQTAIEQVAGKPGANHVPTALKILEVRPRSIPAKGRDCVHCESQEWSSASFSAYYFGQLLTLVLGSNINFSCSKQLYCKEG